MDIPARACHGGEGAIAARNWRISSSRSSLIGSAMLALAFLVLGLPILKQLAELCALVWFQVRCVEFLVEKLPYWLCSEAPDLRQQCGNIVARMRNECGVGFAVNAIMHGECDRAVPIVLDSPFLFQ